MKIILLGPPGSGKGTQAKIICERYKIQHISTGDMLRIAIADKTELGMKAKKAMDKGKLVSDELILQLVEKRISRRDCKYGYLFDGFPRTIAQATEMEKIGIGIDIVLKLQITDKEIIERIGGRRIHPGSNRVYHVKFTPPKIEGIDDETNEMLIQRDDDTAPVVRKRLEVYHRQTAPLINYYSEKNNEPAGKLIYAEINGSSKQQKVSKEIISLLEANYSSFKNI